MAVYYRLIPGTLQARPVKDSFGTDERVVINVKCRVERKDDSWLQLGSIVWHTKYQFFVKGITGPILEKDLAHGPHLPAEVVSVNVDSNFDLGVRPQGLFSGEVVVSAFG